MQRLFHSPKSRRGFTLVELAVVIVIIGVLAAFGVPKFLASVEKSKATEAFNFWAAVQSAEERYLAQNGVYLAIDSGSLPTSSSSLNAQTLDIVTPTLQYFTFGGITAALNGSGTPTWAGTMTRNVSSSSYGAYTVLWSDTGYNSSSTISSYPQISPVTYAASS